jgi:hypothetical protein
LKSKGRLILIIILILTLVVLSVLLFFYLNKKDNEVSTDATEFKEEYESLNGSETSNGYTYPKVSLEDNNPFVYASVDDTIEVLENGTGIIYFGYASCPWCRNAVNVLQHVNTNEILYVDLSDVRDTYEVIDGVLTKTKDGSDGYYRLIKLLDSVLEDYVVDGISTGEKRIYVPLVVGVKEGSIVGYHANTVDLNDGQTAYDTLTNDQQEELKEIYDEISNEVNTNTCDIDSDQGC